MKNISMLKKILALIALFLIALVLVATLSHALINRMAQTGSELYEERLLPIRYLGQIRTDNRALDGYLLEIILASDENDYPELQKSLEERKVEMIEGLANFKKSFSTDHEELKVSITQMESQMNVYFEDVDRVMVPALGIGEEADNAAYRLYTEELRPNREKLIETATSLMDGINLEAEESNKEMQAQRERSILLFWTIVVIGALLSIGLGLYIARLIVRPIRELNGLMERAGNGDLTTESTYVSRDEVGSLSASFNNMKDNLRTLIAGVTTTAGRVATSSDDLKNNVEGTTKATEMVAVTMEEIASGSLRQLARVKESNSTLTELTNGIHHVSDSAQYMTGLSEGALQKVDNGNELISKLENQLGEMNEQVRVLQKVIAQLNVRSQEIGDITGTISSIAEQTNLLALNAAIEAARAGDQGRGFAVVAAEVRKLAEDSAIATKQIASLITHTQSETNEAVQTMEVVEGDMFNSVKNVQEAGVAFEDIKNAIEEVSQKIEEVTGAVQEMAAGATEILTSVNEVQGITETTATETENTSAATEEQMASMEEITASAQELSNMADEMREMTKKFSI